MYNYVRIDIANAETQRKPSEENFKNGDSYCFNYLHIICIILISDYLSIQKKGRY